MFTFEPYDKDGQHGQVLFIQNSNDGIAMHRHDDPAYRHSITVLEGVCHCYGPGKTWSVILYEGQSHTFTDAQQEHEIVALRNRTKLLSLWPTGRPAFEDQVPEDQKTGTIRRQLTRGK